MNVIFPEFEAARAPSPRVGEGWGEGGAGLDYQHGSSLDHHPLPGPLPSRERGQSAVRRRMSMGSIVGAALASHHPGLFQSDEFRIKMGDGADSDLIPGYDRLRAKIDAVKPDTFIIFDTHWFTTGYHLIDGGRVHRGSYISDEMPWYLYGQAYNYQGNPELAGLIEEVAVERGVMSKAVYDHDLPKHYATINVANKLVKNEKGERVVSVSICQNCEPHHFIESGCVIAEEVGRAHV